MGIYVGWAAMVVAMMAPTAVPMLRTYADVQHARSGRSTGAGFWAFLGGYLVVWVAASAAFATAQVALRSVTAGAFSPLLLAALLAIAGGYQLTSFKQACAHHCRSPLLFLLAHWRDGTAGAVALGLRHGVDCVACCWALMLLALAGGAGQPFLMAAVMVVAAVEKLPVVGVRVTRPLGLALLGGAVGCGLFGVL
jgi:predicted metal-binding membrane protein